MFRVIGVETGDHPRREFVVIRNQSLRYEKPARLGGDR
jgi:hypothetical protein